MSDRIERIILRNLFYNEDFTRKALPFIKSEFFTNHNESTLFGDCLLYTSPSPRD